MINILNEIYDLFRSECSLWLRDVHASPRATFPPSCIAYVVDCWRAGSSRTNLEVNSWCGGKVIRQHLVLPPLDFPVLVVRQLDVTVSLLNAMSSASQSTSELQMQFVDYASGRVRSHFRYQLVS